MRVDHSVEQRFMNALDALIFGDRDDRGLLLALDAWSAAQRETLQRSRMPVEGLAPAHPLAALARALNRAVLDVVAVLSSGWTHLNASEALADLFEHRLLLLVSGKFNAGKSSLCNLLAERFRARGQTVSYFYLDGDVVVESQTPFEEGATETTARLQGVRLGSHLVLLDTPGLHSMTCEHAALTRLYMESADALLWLTSSSSPGQVDELERLSRELWSGKPLLPVITRSDYFEEDEVDGEIRKVLRNKPGDVRSLQERDVAARAREKLISMQVDPALLNEPVSVSAHLARQSAAIADAADAPDTSDALKAAGVHRLYDRLLDMMQVSVAYKGGKRAAVRLHYLEENIVARIRREVFPLLDEIEAGAASTIDELEHRRTRIATMMWRAVAPGLPDLLDAQGDRGDAQAVYEVLAAQINDAFNHEVAVQLGDYVFPADRMATHAGWQGEPEPERHEDATLKHHALTAAVLDDDFVRRHTMLATDARGEIDRLARWAADECIASTTGVLEAARRLRSTLESREADLPPARTSPGVAASCAQPSRRRPRPRSHR